MSGQLLNLGELVLPLNVARRLRTWYSVGPYCIKTMMADAAGLGVFLCSVKPVLQCFSLLLFCNRLKVSLSCSF